MAAHIQAGERLHRFHGGLRLRHNKKVSCLEPVRRAPMPDRLYLPLLQHRGEPVRCLVSVGDTVLGGQLIGEVSNSGANIHAGTSGRIREIAELPVGHPSGQPDSVVVIEPDGQDQWGKPAPLEGWQDCDPSDLRNAIRAAGIVGLGGAVFPTGSKTDSGQAAGVHTLILNGAECEPFISCDEMLMREQPNLIVRGALILQRATGATNTVIAIEDQMGAVRSALLSAVEAEGADSVRVKRIPTVYPEGGERQLVQVLTGLEVPMGKFPQDLGLLVQNVATAAAVATALEQGKPLVERVVTVTGNGVQNPCNLLALLGTPVAELVEAAGGYTDTAERLVIGGPMMGFALASDAEPVVKATNCVLVLSQEDVRDPQPEMPCIRCGECARVCPAQLMPQELHYKIRSGQLDAAADWGLGACIECGCCDFVCPSHIPLVEWFRHGKSASQALAEEREFSELSKNRFDARQERLERQKAEKSDRLAKRKQKLKNQAESKKQVAAAIARANKGKTPGPDGDDQGSGTT